MYYDFTCDTCKWVTTVEAKISDGPTAPECPFHNHGVMRRIYGDVQTTVYHSKAYDYMDMAYRGETQVPGMSTAQVRAIMDKSTEHIRKGRANSVRTLKAKTLR